MALDLEDAEEPSAQVDAAGVLAWTDGDRRPARRQRPQELLRMLVRAVLAPHRTEHRPLELVRLATDEIANESSLVFGEARVVWNLVRLRRFRRPQGRGRTHVREIAPRGAITGKSSGLGQVSGTHEFLDLVGEGDEVRNSGLDLAEHVVVVGLLAVVGMQVPQVCKVL